MKQIATTIFIAFLTCGAFAQPTNPYPKTISVIGSAETEIIPDEIYVVVQLTEYEKKGQGKIGLEKIKTDFLGFCRSIGLPDSTVTIASYEGYNNYPWWRKRKNKDELYASIAYQVKLSSSKKMDELVEKLDEDATQNFVISRVSHSKIKDYRKQLKIDAVKAARDKGGYLAEAIGEKLGEAVTITEPEEPQYYTPTVENVYSNYMTRSKANPLDNNDNGKGTDFKNIKLRYEVKAVFALK